MAYKTPILSNHRKTKLAFSLGGFSLLIAIALVSISPFSSSLPGQGNDFDAGGFLNEPQNVIPPLSFEDKTLNGWTYFADELNASGPHFLDDALVLKHTNDGLKSPIVEPNISPTRIKLKIKDATSEDIQGLFVISSFSIDHKNLANIDIFTIDKDGYFTYSVINPYTSYLTITQLEEKETSLLEVKWVYTNDIKDVEEHDPA